MSAVTRQDIVPSHLLQTVVEHSVDWLALFDGRRRCVFLNRPLRGLQPAAAMGLPVEEFAPPEDRAKVHACFEHVLRTGEARDFEQVVTDPNERGPRYLEWRVRAVREAGEISGAVVNITEVTERRAQRDTLRTQSRILETMREGVVLVDSVSSIIRLANPALGHMFGYQPGELLGQSILPLCRMPAVQRERVQRNLREAVNTAAPALMQPVEFECERRDGSRFMASCVITPLRMSGADHWLAVMTDVTERKRLEREIIEIANREQQRIGGDLHDGLGQDLTGIALMLRGVAQQLGPERILDDVEEIIGLVNNAIESTRTLARGLSPVSAMRGGLLAALQTLADRSSERYGIRVTFKAECDGAAQRLEENAATHLYRIAQEALTNVARHSLASEVAIRIGTADDGEGLQLSIDDNGRGFEQRPADEFDGLGLKIMRYRAQMLSGDLMLESSPSGGTSVRCLFPAP